MSQEGLNEKQIAAFERRLRELKDELESLLSTNADATRPVDLDEPIWRISRVDAIAQQNMSQASRGQQQTRLRLIDAALEAIDRGEYGECRSCGELIGTRRLEARPESPFCLDCQEERETSR